MKSKYIGQVVLSGVTPFAHDSLNPFVWLIKDGRTEVLWANSTVKQMGSWMKQSLLNGIKSGKYAYLDAANFNKYFPLNKIEEKPKSMSALSIKKGSLYFNSTSTQVERVITIQDSSLIWTSRHKQQAKAYPRSAFRIANQIEVQNYLAEAQANS